MRNSSRIPGTIIGAAIVMFTYGALLLLCVTCGGVSLTARPPDQMGLQAAMDKKAPGNTVVSIASLGFNFLFALTFIGAGFGVLWLSQIARFIAYGACLAILMTTCAGTIYQTFVVSPVVERVMAQQLRVQGPAPINVNAIMAGSRVVGVIIALGIPLLFCTPISVLLTVKSARDAFAGKFPEEPSPRKRRPRYEDDDDDDDDYGRPSRSDEYPGDTGIKA